MTWPNVRFDLCAANLRGYMTTCYHHECDDIQRVTSDMINFAAKTCRTLISLVNKMSPVVDDTSSSCECSHQQCVSQSANLLHSLTYLPVPYTLLYPYFPFFTNPPPSNARVMIIQKPSLSNLSLSLSLSVCLCLSVCLSLSPSSSLSHVMFDV